MFDSDFCNYFIHEKGQVASAADLGGSRIHGNIADLKPGEYYIFDHCPTASAPRGHIFQGPNSWWIIDVARDWYPNSREVRPRLDFTGAHAGHRFILGLRPNETYTRHWQPLGTGTLFARPFPNGKDPMQADGSPLRNSRANGEWNWTPNLADASVLFAAENLECSAEGLRAQDKDKPAWGVLRVMAANVVTSARFDAQFLGFTRFSVSGNGGLAWSPVEFTAGQSGLASAVVAQPLAGRLEYLIRVDLSKGARVKGLTVKTLTQVNPRTLPALRLGKNQIAAVSDAHLEVATLNPRLADGQHSNELARAEGWQAMQRPRDWDPSIRSLEKAEAVLRLATPRDIRHVRMACTAHLTEPSGAMELSVKGGEEWKKLATFEFEGAPYDRRAAVESRDFAPGTREVSVRYAMDSGGNGLVNAFAEVGYEPAGGFMPYDITYCWSEYRGGKWVVREHVERVKTANHRYAIHVGGERPPKMNWMRMAPAGGGATGYADGEDVGVKFARPAYSLVYGENVSLGCPYEVSRPAGSAFPDLGGRLTNMAPDRLLTDGFIGESSLWKLDNINLSGGKNDGRVGELVVWEPGAPVTVTVDLGKIRMIGGARVCAIQPNPSVLYPAKMTVETSVDGQKFDAAGEAAWDDCFFPPGNQMQWSGFDSPVYEALPAGGMISYRFPILFAARVNARYVRFVLAAPTDKKAGIGLYELDVWDRLEKKNWDERLVLP
jgi:hypothetical protein